MSLYRLPVDMVSFSVLLVCVLKCFGIHAAFKSHLVYTIILHSNTGFARASSWPTTSTRTPTQMSPSPTTSDRSSATHFRPFFVSKGTLWLRLTTSSVATRPRTGRPTSAGVPFASADLLTRHVMHRMHCQWLARSAEIRTCQFLHPPQLNKDPQRSLSSSRIHF